MYCVTTAPESDFEEIPAEETVLSTKEPAEPGFVMIPSVMIDGVMYMTTGFTTTYISTQAGEGFGDGKITSEVPNSELPAQNDQSNFGTGFGYRYGEREGTVELELDRNWVIFATEEVRQELQFPGLTADTASTPDSTNHS